MMQPSRISLSITATVNYSLPNTTTMMHHTLFKTNSASHLPFVLGLFEPFSIPPHDTLPKRLSTLFVSQAEHPNAFPRRA